MPGHPCPASLQRKTWMPGTRPAMTLRGLCCSLKKFTSHLERHRHRHMVGRPLPAARILGHLDGGEPVAETLRNPDVIETAAAIGGLPIVHRAVAPPGEELF